MAESDGGEQLPPSVQARIDTVTQQRREAMAEAKELRAKLAELETKAQGAEALQAQLNEYKQKEASWADERTILGAGITDPDGVDFARMAWNRVPADQRPKGGLSEWLSKPDALPKAVRAYLPDPASAASTASSNTGQAAAGGGQPAQGGQRTGAGLPPSNQGAVPGQAPGGQPKLSAAEIAAMPLSEYAKVREDVLAGKR